jgi:hypothetical protein
LAGKAASISDGHTRRSFSSSTATYKPAGSQKLTQVLSGTERKFPDSAQTK